MRLLIVAMLLLTQTAAAEQALWWPAWSEVTGVRYNKSVAGRLPARIVAVGGEPLLVAPYHVTPGSHRIVLESPPFGGFTGTVQSLDLEFQPCYRYYVNAQFDSRDSPDWRPVVDAIERVQYCPLPGT